MGFSSAGRAQASRARLQAALENVNVTRTELLRNLRSLLANQRLQAGQLTSLKASEIEIRELLASFQRQYEAGFKSWQEVLNMQREHYDQMMQRAQAESEWLAYTLRIKALTGDLDEVAGVTKD
jgi:adhesin transport system outer membrane protein